MKDKKPETKSPPRPIDYVWLDRRFDNLERQHALILDRIDEVKKLVIASGTSDNLNPELSAALLETARNARVIDEKVPDSKFFPQTKPPTSNERTSQ